MLVKDKLVVVTGAGSGMGKEITLNLLAKGAKVAAVDLRPETLTELKKEVDGKNLEIYATDISDRTAVEKLPEQIIARQGQVDALINNAGIIQPFVKVNDLEYDAIERVMNVNFFGALYMTKAFLPHLLKRPQAYISNTSSMGGFLPVPGQSIYGASKAAVKLMTEALYAELKDTNVGVSVVFPGAVATNITENSGVKTPEMPKGEGKAQNFKALPAKEAARIIVKGIEKGKLYIIVGQDSALMNLLYRISPKFATNLIARKMSSLLSN